MIRNGTSFEWHLGVSTSAINLPSRSCGVFCGQHIFHFVPNKRMAANERFIELDKTIGKNLTFIRPMNFVGVSF